MAITVQKLKNYRKDLISIGAALVADGDFGPKTEAAVKLFQNKNSLVETGIVDDKLWALLLAGPKMLRELEFLKTAPLPGRAIKAGVFTKEKLVAKIWKEYGGLLEVLSKELGFDPSIAVAVLCVESNGTGFAVDGRMIIRFENHIFYDQWGKSNPVTFAKYFSYDSSKRWLNHKYRTQESNAWITLHSGSNTQDKEWDAITFASTLSDDAAFKSASYGLAQIMGFNYKQAGYSSGKEMFEDFKIGIREQVISFFEFVRGGRNMLTALKKNDWSGFASEYNGSGKAASYGALISEYYNIGKKLGI